jgi:hypothetical protein
MGAQYTAAKGYSCHLKGEWGNIRHVVLYLDTQSMNFTL